jgi:methylmalonyl-CoA/ethylmalonyl-CoA epimerase
MMQKIEHIGIAVRDIRASEKLYTQILGVSSYKTEEVLSEYVITVFFKTGESKIELLAATNEESPIHKFIEKRGEGIHHVAFGVEDIIIEMERMKSEGFRLLNNAPKRGADNKLICFVHPKDADGVLIELCQDI